MSSTECHFVKHSSLRQTDYPLVTLAPCNCEEKGKVCSEVIRFALEKYVANNRRDFLKKAAVAGAGMALYPALGKGRAWAFAQSPTGLRKFVTSVPGLGPSAKN